VSTVRTIVEKAKAGYPALYVVSPEEQRVIGDIEKAGKVLDRKVYTWSLGRGLVTKTAKGQGRVEDTDNPENCLQAMGKLDKGSIVVLRNFHHFLENPTIQALLLDLIPSYKLSQRMLIISTPVLRLPPEIVKELSVIDVELPDKEELGATLDGIASNSSKPSPEVREKLIEAGLGLTTNEFENAAALSGIKPNLDINFQKKGDSVIWDPAIVMAEKCDAAKQTGIMTFYPPTKAGLSAIGGMQLYKNWVEKRAKSWTKEAREFGLPIPIGTLMLGPAGSGKSVGAQATADAFGLPLIRVDMGAIFGGLVGASEANARSVIKFLEAVSPCVGWLDEIEKGFAGSGGGQLDSGVGARVLGTFLTWMSEKTKPVFIYATANSVHSLPPELLRKGRFDEMFFVNFPTFKEREEIFKIHIVKRGRGAMLESGKLKLADLAEQTRGFSGAEIEAVIREALFDSFAAGKDLNMFDIGEAISNVTPLSKSMKPQVDALIEWATGRTRPANLPEEFQGQVAGVARSVQV
jgi:SpoVK/Ycf46/Vps4 family AAA+-type ATPase